MIRICPTRVNHCYPTVTSILKLVSLGANQSLIQVKNDSFLVLRPLFILYLEFLGPLQILLFYLTKGYVFFFLDLNRKRISEFSWVVFTVWIILEKGTPIILGDGLDDIIRELFSLQRLLETWQIHIRPWVILVSWPISLYVDLEEHLIFRADIVQLHFYILIVWNRCDPSCSILDDCRCTRPLKSLFEIIYPLLANLQHILNGSYFFLLWYGWLLNIPRILRLQRIDIVRSLILLLEALHLDLDRLFEFLGRGKLIVSPEGH
jgi:hypothetical protein